jgi:hypothetical protein
MKRPEFQGFDLKTDTQTIIGQSKKLNYPNMKNIEKNVNIELITLQNIRQPVDVIQATAGITLEICVGKILTI